jgi:two-component system, NtrC family, response regulator HydG
MTIHALLIDDDEATLRTLDDGVRAEGFDTTVAKSLGEARREIGSCVPDLALIDLELPDGDGMDLVRELHRQALGTEVVVVARDGSADAAVGALKAGAVDYLTRPVDPRQLHDVLARRLRTLALRSRAADLRSDLRSHGRFGDLVGSTRAMQRVYDLIARVAPTDSTVLVTGETGTGKELVAQTVHALSTRSGRPFLGVNCAAIQPSLIESELFGHERGSFTGADKRHQGLFERADGGSLFLDEITEMSPELQSKLLRVLETGSFVRVGGSRPVEVDVRVIAATNRDPREAVEHGELREDLFYRLMVFPIQLPPLRDRLEDVELLAGFFLDELNAHAPSPKRLTAEALDRLRGHDWPGNVRELRNVIERAFILASDRIEPDFLFLGDAPAAAEPASSRIEIEVGLTVKEAERRLILATLETVGRDKKLAAKMLGISLKTLYTRLNAYGVKYPSPRRRR